jgi:hypothetical protein
MEHLRRLRLVEKDQRATIDQLMDQLQAARNELQEARAEYAAKIEAAREYFVREATALRETLAAALAFYPACRSTFRLSGHRSCWGHLAPPVNLAIRASPSDHAIGRALNGRFVVFNSHGSLPFCW